MPLHVLFQKPQSLHWKEKSEADGSTSACLVGCFTTARRLALKIFTETTHSAGGSERNRILPAWVPEARRPKGSRLCGVTPGDGHPGRAVCVVIYHFTRMPGEGRTPRPSQAGAPEGLFRQEMGTSPSPASAGRGELSATRAFEQRPEGTGTAGPMLQPAEEGSARWLVPLIRAGRGAAAVPRGAAALRGGAGAGKLPEVSGCPSQPRAQPPALARSPKAPTAPAD